MYFNRKYEKMSISERLRYAYAICKECELEECDRKKQKILDCNMKVLEYYADLQAGTGGYPYKGGIRQQAQWFKYLYGVLCDAVNEIRKKND